MRQGAKDREKVKEGETEDGKKNRKAKGWTENANREKSKRKNRKRDEMKAEKGIGQGERRIWMPAGEVG